MSQLQQIQDAILQRFKQPPQPWDEHLPDGPANPDLETAGTPPVRTGVGPQAGDAPDLNTVQPLPTRSPSPYAPPPQPMSGAAPSTVAPTQVDAGTAPPATELTNPATGEPHREVYGADKKGYRDALDRWKPANRRSVGQVAKEFALGAANAVNQTGNPWSAIGGGGAGAVSGVVQPNEINRRFKLNRANSDYERQLGEQKEAAQVSSLGQVPVTLANGTTVYTTKAHAAELINKQQGIVNSQDKAAQTAKIAHQRIIASTYNNQREFDPANPSNARLVAEFTKEFGYPPPKKSSGSLLQVVEGEDEQGNPKFSVIDKGTGTATGVTGDVPAVTNNQANRDSRESEGAANRENRTANVNTQQAGQDRRAAGRGATGGMKPAAARAANALVQKYNETLAGEVREKNAQNKQAYKARRESLWQQIFDTYPGVFEADPQSGNIRMKAQQGGQPSGGSFDLKGWKAAHSDATPDQVDAMRQKAKARGLAVVE